MLISVIIPTKERSRELKRAIDSVLRQSHQLFEVLVIDDQSDEDIEKIVNSYSDPRLHYILNVGPRTNANACRNIGINQAKGEYIAMLDSDDEWLDDHLECKLRFHEQSGCDGSFGSSYLDDGQDRTLRISRPIRDNESMIDYVLSGGKAQTSSFFFTASCAKQLHWDEDLLRHQDYDYAARFGQQFRFIPSDHATSIIHWKKGEKRQTHFESHMRLIQKFEHQISPRILANYALNMLVIMRDSNAQVEHISKYFKHIIKIHIKSVSYLDYSVLAADRNSFWRLMLRLKYIYLILFA